jgi:hypothetical protein
VVTDTGTMMRPDQIHPLHTFCFLTSLNCSLALVAVARPILTIIWHLLATPPPATHDLGADYHTRRIDTERHTRSHVRQLEALGDKVTLAADA